MSLADTKQLWPMAELEYDVAVGSFEDIFYRTCHTVGLGRVRCITENNEQRHQHGDENTDDDELLAGHGNDHSIKRHLRVNIVPRI